MVINLHDSNINNTFSCFSVFNRVKLISEYLAFVGIKTYLIFVKKFIQSIQKFNYFFFCVYKMAPIHRLSEHDQSILDAIFNPLQIGGELATAIYKNDEELPSGLKGNTNINILL